MATEPATDPVAAARDQRARIGVSAAYAVQGLCFAGVLTQVPDLKARFGFSDGALSLILLAVPVVAGVGSVLAGVLAPRLGSALVLRVAGVGVAVAVALIGLAPVRPALYLAVAFFGLVVGAVDATMNMQGVGVQRRYGRSLLASFHAWWSVGGIAGALAMSGAGRLEWSLGASLGLVAVVGLVVALAAGPSLLTKAEEGTPTAGAAPSGDAPRIPWRPVMLVGLAVMVMYIGESSVSNWSAVFLRDVLAASRGLAPLGLAGYLIFQLAGRTVADRVVERIGVVRTVAAGGVVGAAGFGLVVAARTPAWALAGFAIVGVGLCVVVPMAFSAAGALDPTESGVAIARVNLFNYVGFVVGAGLIGAIAETADLRLAFGVPAVLALAIVPLSLAFRVAESVRSRAARATASR
jgi:MFS family permease